MKDVPREPHPPAVPRREFLTAALSLAGATAVGAAGPGSAPAGDADAPAVREFFELRRYQLRRGPQVERFDAFHAEVAVPAWNRAGVRAVGVLDTFVGPDIPVRHVLLPFRSLEHLQAARDAYEADPAVAEAAFTRTPATEPAYLRMDSTLLRAFAGQPRLEVPSSATGGGSRIFELRTYEAHSRRANRKKVEMFDRGELAIFRRCGLTPVFFGEALIGPRLPALTYLLTFPDLAAREASWAVFREDPEWRKLSRTPGYTDPEILTNIHNAFLRPTACSQI